MEVVPCVIGIDGLNECLRIARIPAVMIHLKYICFNIDTGIYNPVFSRCLKITSGKKRYSTPCEAC